MKRDGIALTCPRCDERLEGAASRGRVTFGTEIRVPVACPACAASLEIVVQPDLSEDVEAVSVWAEDRREESGAGDDR
ncbi:MAG: hypothetical protein ACOCR0_00470 [Haloferacaceae archaeon]